MGRMESLDEIKAEVRAMTGKSKIFRRARPADVESVLAKLTSKDPGLLGRRVVPRSTAL